MAANSHSYNSGWGKVGGGRPRVAGALFMMASVGVGRSTSSGQSEVGVMRIYQSINLYKLGYPGCKNHQGVCA